MNIITLISDFGTGSYHVARVKGVLHLTVNDAIIIDITHNVDPWDVEQAIVLMASTYKTFAENTIHLIGVNESSTEHIAAKLGKRWFIAPDNGILYELLKSEPAEFYSIGSYILPSFFEKFYPKVVKAILNNEFPNEQTLKVQPQMRLFNSFNIKGDTLKAYYIYFDKYENAVVNLKKEDFYQFVEGYNFKIKINESDGIDKISVSYFQSNKGELIAIFNSAGYLEIGFTFGKAKQLFGLKKKHFIIIERTEK